MDRARRMVQLMLRNYRRLAFINTGEFDLERYRAIAGRPPRTSACGSRRSKVRRRSSRSSCSGLDDECVVVPRGETVRLDDFLQTAPPEAVS